MYDIKRISQLAGLSSLNHLSKINESAPPGMEDLVMKLKQKFPGHEEKAFATAWSIYNKKKQHNESAVDTVDSSVEDDSDFNRSYGKEDWNDFKLELLIRKIGFGKTKREVQKAYDENRIDHDKAQHLMTELGKKYSHESGKDSMHKFMLESEHEIGNETEFGSEPAPHNEVDSVNMDVPLLIRMLEFAKEDAKDDIELHKAAEALIKLASDGNTLDMNDYNNIVSDVGSDEGELEEADINNGYDDRHKADEFGKYPGFGFPTGADSPVTKKTGPSGARQGDNPEQKKMAVSEDTYKEMVYKYRSHLKESNNLPALSVSLEDYDPSLCRNDGETVHYVGDVTVTGKGLTKFGRIVDISYGILLHAYGDIVRENEESPETFNSETGNIKYTQGTSMHVDNITVHSVELDKNVDFQINDNSFAADEAEGILDKSTIAMIKSPDTYRSIAEHILSKSVE